MYAVEAVRLTTALVILTLLNAEEVSPDNNAFSRVAKVNLKYDTYKDHGKIYQIDMKIPSDYYKRRRSPRAATSEKNKLWSKGIVPYIIADSIMKRRDHHDLLEGAMKEWEKKTCLQFKKRTRERDYVEFYYGTGCNSDVGVMGIGRQTTSLGEGCGDHGIMVHEIGHLLGLYHEQNRPDRDKYVKILKKNIIPTYHYAFDMKDEEEIDSRSVPYDYYSVMHYGSTDFSKNKEATIVALKKGITHFGNDKISNLDAKVVNLMYGCPELIKFPNDFHWKHYGLNSRDKKCIRVNEPEDPYSWNNNYLCRRKGKTIIGLEWSHKGPIEGMSCIKAVAPSMQGKYSWDDNYFCWPKDSVYKFTWWTRTPDRSMRHQCIKIYEPRDRMWKKMSYYLCGKKDESPVDGEWSAWSEWSRCTRQCGGGFHRRVRACNNPPPSYGGLYCQGNNFMTGSCGTNSCDEWPNFPDDFVYRKYDLPPNDKICLRTFERFDFYRWTHHLFCTPDDKKDPYFTWSDVGPVPGQRCVRIFNPVESKRIPNSWNNNYLCAPKDSPYKFVYSRKGKIRGYRCLQWFPEMNSGWDNNYLCAKGEGGSQPKGGGVGENPSPNGDWEEWGEWTKCTKTCAGGIQRRFRSCSHRNPYDGKPSCTGDSYASRRCNVQGCFVDGMWSDWRPWTKCTKSCGGGEQQRRRTCSNPAPQNGGKTCTGVDVVRRRCNENLCAIHGGWSPWSWWGRCSMTCGQGIQLRSRTCSNPTPRDGGRMCFGLNGETRMCNSGPCPIHGNWGRWSSWNECSKLCSGGVQIRRRSCSNPPAQFGGRECLGEDNEEQRCNTFQCPIDGAWTQWFGWRACSKSCGGGVQTRRRTCSDPMPRYGGKKCYGKNLEEQGCQTQPCPLPPVHGNWSPWMSWQPCTKTCAGGVEKRIRTCTNPPPRHHGRACRGISFQERRCNTATCPREPIHGRWGSWSLWNACTKSCGGGKQFRKRLCTDPKPAFGGRDCRGRSLESRQCNTKPCRVDGRWSLWLQWNACSKSCGGGTQLRKRTCTNPRPSNGGRPCRGRSFQTQKCNTKTCRTRVDGRWSLWLQWNACSKSCGGGTQLRRRTCTNPRPSNGGRPCRGRSFQTQKCNTKTCRTRVDGRWSLWSQWNACSKSCGGGMQLRRRTCTNPRPSNGGRPCRGRSFQTQKCNTKTCRTRVDGRWSPWSSWRSCTKQCGGGFQRRERTCTNPRPSNGGHNCGGPSFETKRCNNNPCSVDGRWSPWSSWRSCTKQCGGGFQRRERTCTNPRPSNGGHNCGGSSFETKRCNNNPCGVDGRWSPWSSWRSCTKQCGGGFQRRERTCTNPRPSNGGHNCAGPSFETKRCNNNPCGVDGRWNTWSLWKACSRSCGGGRQQRTRSCTNPRPSNGGRDCDGPTFQSRKCNTRPCRINGRWSPWSSWRSCTKQCGGGFQRRERTCTNPRPSNGGHNCAGPSFETKRCKNNPCRVAGRWNTWSHWKACSRLCGGGVQQRTRSCSRPSNGGRNCYGPTYQLRTCNTTPCRIDGKWSKWSSWQQCNRQCGGGTQRRVRSCTNPRPVNGGKNCYGRATQNRRCNTRPCRVDGRWSNWTPWGACSASCNGGSQRRHRTCSNPAPSYGGRQCRGQKIEERRCNQHPCPRSGVAGWGEWSDCSASCGGGIQSRKCLERCSRGKLQKRSCNTFRCKMNCGGEVSGYGGKITSPRYPAYYPNDIECTWIINVPEGMKVKLRFSFFYMENGATCQNDYVELRDGPSYESSKLGRFCGTSRPETQMSTDSRMWVRFRANSYHTYNGFSASWSPTKDSLATKAASKVNGVYNANADCSAYIRSNYGRLTSPGYPNAYHPNLNCEWIITVSKGRIIQFYFDDLDVDDRGYCRYDYVGLRDGDSRSSPSLGRFCGNKTPARERSKTTSNALRIRFKTDDSTQRKGFSLWWTSYYKYKASKPRRNIKGTCPHNWTPYQENNQLYCYSLRKHYHTWDQAYVKCAQWGAHLASVQSELEQDFLRYHVLKDNYAWFGLSDYKQEGNWTWSDGTSLTYSNWARGEPNKGENYLNEHCALMKPNGRWNDYPCDFKFMFVCKRRQET